MDRRHNWYQLGLYEKSMPTTMTWVERLQQAKNLGFDFVEISIDESDERLNRLYDEALIIEIEEAIRVTKVPIQSMCLSGHRKYPLGSLDDSVREKGMEIFYLAVDFAVRLGIRVIQLAGYDVYYEEGNALTRERFLQSLIKGIEYAASRQVLCGLETMETDFMNTVEKALKYTQLIKSPYCQIYPDLGNLMNASLMNGDLYEDINLGKGFIVAAHLKETVPGKYREIQFGQGHVDFQKGIDILWDVGVRSFVCECWYVGQEDYLVELAFNYSFIYDKIEKSIRREYEN